MSKAIFYHAGCPVCAQAEHGLLQALNASAGPIEVVHLVQEPSRLAEADAIGVKTVPALVLDGQVFHINFGASLDDLKHA
ncbi:MAG: thioredoxin family protein [Methylobacter sp.]|nr:MAG: thioredoxin family protein [Methylobacter sp.]PPD02438.1 MAG: thioredoxin family protein [Methylobacter sp.]PPD17576.1 MAG: thioredoxin family protein [Methylobacter sp.]